jgi:cell fate (sporulation/competence/biofilm development) regulator YmcA (YheA/YmcA/DUF963 family)
MSALHILKTNIRSLTDYETIRSVLDHHPAIEQWTIDRTDVDSVLRIFSSSLSCADSIHLIVQQGFCCEELI